MGGGGRRRRGYGEQGYEGREKEGGGRERGSGGRERKVETVSSFHLLSPCFQPLSSKELGSEETTTVSCISVQETGKNTLFTCACNKPHLHSCSAMFKS